MTKKKFLIIIWSITLLCIIFGTMGHFGGWLFSSAGKMVENTETFNGNVSEVIIDADVAELEVSYGHELSVSYSYPEKYLPKVSMKDGVLLVEQRAKNYKPSNASNSCEMAVVIPKRTQLKNFEAQVRFGEVDVKDVESDVVKVDADCGDVEVSNITAESGVCTLNLGDLDVSNGTFKYLTVSLDMGDLDVNADFDTLDAHCDLGDMDIQTSRDLDDVKIKANCDLGDIKVNGEKW